MHNDVATFSAASAQSVASLSSCIASSRVLDILKTLVSRCVADQTVTPAETGCQHRASAEDYQRFRSINACNTGCDEGQFAQSSALLDDGFGYDLYRTLFYRNETRHLSLSLFQHRFQRDCM